MKKLWKNEDESCYRHTKNSSPSYSKKENGFGNGHRSSSPASPVLNKTSTARWVGTQFLHDVRDRNELIFRKVRGILNKLTPEKFDKLTHNLVNIGIDNRTVLKGIIILIFEKAIEEPKYCSLYARLCQRLSKDAPNFDVPAGNTTTFLRLLLSKCQEEFETRSKASSAFDRKDGLLSAADQEAKYMAKRKMLGNIKFIGELGKLELLQEAILHKCIQQLLAKKKRIPLADVAEDIECLCQIISTVGKRLDTPKARNIMEQYFDRIHTLWQSDELPSRIHFLLQDVLDLRQNNWIPRRLQRENGPRSVTQMRWELMGPMMPPPFPYHSSDGQNGFDTDMYNGSYNNGFGWFPDPLSYSNGMLPPSAMGKMMNEYADDSKDIFGKPVNKAPVPSKLTKTTKQPTRVDPFEPHYLKSKSNGNKSSSPNNVSKPTKGVVEEEQSKPRLNKGNPWNIDPFVPHYNKPTVFPVNEEASKTKEISPRVEMKNLPQNSRSNGSTHQKTLRKDQDISLRPASMLVKKDEKPKAFGKTEELPPKMQQFTNLTINDKTTTNTKSKKTGLSKADIDKKLTIMYENYSKDQSLDAVFTEIQSITTNIKYSKMAAKQLFAHGANLSKEDHQPIANIFLECERRSILSRDTIVNALFNLIDDNKVMVDTYAKEFVACISALFIYNELITMSTFIDHFQDGIHYPTVMLCLADLLQVYGEDWLEKAHLDSNIDLKLTFPKDMRSDEKVLETAREKKLAFLFPHLCLKEELLTLMKSGCKEDEILRWVKTHVENKVERKQLIHMITTCAIAMATIPTLQNSSDHTRKPDKEYQDKERLLLDKMKPLLREYLASKPLLQLEAVYALQLFCFEKGFPKEMLLRLFIIFYNSEIIDEDVFLKWKEDLNDTYPGKGKALFQVNNWLQWLETADEEEEDDDDNDDD